MSGRHPTLGDPAALQNAKAAAAGAAAAPGATGVYGNPKVKVLGGS
jgi:hypothetical protein